MATLQPNVWWLEMMARACEEEGPQLAPRGERQFAVYVEEVTDE